MNVLPPAFPGVGEIPVGPDPLLPLLVLLRQDPKEMLPALLTPLRSPVSPLLWSITVPGLKLPIFLSLPPESLPLKQPHQSFSGSLFEVKNQLFFRSDLSGNDGKPFLLLVGDLPSGDRSGIGSKSEETVPDRIFSSSEEVSFAARDRPGTQTAPMESHFLKTGEVPNPLSLKVSGPYPPGMPSPGGAPPFVEFEVRWPDREGVSAKERPSSPENPLSLSFRLSVSYANGERLDLFGVYDPSSRKLGLHPRSQSLSLMDYWQGLGGILGEALNHQLSLFLSGSFPSERS